MCYNGVSYMYTKTSKSNSILIGWPSKILFSNFGDGILEQVGTVCHLQSPSLKYKIRRWYKTQHIGIDFLMKEFKIYERKISDSIEYYNSGRIVTV